MPSGGWRQRKLTIADRLEAKTERIPECGCWLWVGALTDCGYGRISIGKRGANRLRSTHRVSWEVHNGHIPSGMMVLHRCDVRQCINPDHLFLGTQLDNMDDASKKGRLSNRNRISHELEKRIIELQHLPQRNIAALVGTSVGTVCRYLRRHRGKVNF